MKITTAVATTTLILLTASMALAQYAAQPGPAGAYAAPGYGYPGPVPGYGYPAGPYAMPAAYSPYGPQAPSYGPPAAPYDEAGQVAPAAAEAQHMESAEAASAAPVQSYSGGGNCGCGCDGYCGGSIFRKGIFSDYLYLRPRNAEIAYAQPSRGPANQVTTPVPLGAAEAVLPDYSSGYRVGFVLPLGCDAAVVAAYTKFESDHSDTALVAAPTVLFPLVIDPSSRNAATSTLAGSAHYDIDFELLDLEYKSLWCYGERHFVTYSLGARYARLDQDFAAAFNFNGTTNVLANVDFEGAGARLGLAFERCTMKPAWTIYGQSYASLIAGEFHGSYSQASTPGALTATARFDEARLVPILDLELGVAWRSHSGRLKVHAGYMFSSWFNILTMEDFIEGVQDDRFDDVSGAMTFDGLVTGAEFSF